MTTPLRPRPGVSPDIIALDSSFFYGRHANSPELATRPLAWFLPDLDDLATWFPQIAVRWDQDAGDLMADAVGYQLFTGASAWGGADYTSVRVHALNSDGYIYRTAAFTHRGGEPDVRCGVAPTPGEPDGGWTGCWNAATHRCKNAPPTCDAHKSNCCERMHTTPFENVHPHWFFTDTGVPDGRGKVFAYCQVRYR